MNNDVVYKKIFLPSKCGHHRYLRFQTLRNVVIRYLDNADALRIRGGTGEFLFLEGSTASAKYHEVGIRFVRAEVSFLVLDFVLGTKNKFAIFCGKLSVFEYFVEDLVEFRVELLIKRGVI